MLKIYKPILWLLFINLFACNQKQAPKFQLPSDVDKIMNFAMSQYTNAVQTLTDTTKAPIHGNADGTWIQKETSDWVSGFFAGILWHFYQYTNDPFWEKQARKWNAALEKEKFNTGTHDLGFMLYNSFGNGFRLTKYEKYGEILLQGAESLIARFNPNVGTIKSWNSAPGNHLTIIDNMMNLEYLFWASKVSGDSKYQAIAIRHADVTLKNHFREDGSSYHVLNYDPQTGEVKEKKTAQGFSDESSWARGQAWGGYGFTMMYRETGDPRYLEIAQKTFNCFIERLPRNMVPYWDFDAPNIPNEPKESSAAAIAASALLELSMYVKDSNQKDRYYQTALNLLEALSTDRYLAKVGKYQCILLHSNGSVPAGEDVDVNFTYADYYYVEALLRLKKL
jgi:unsaturated chondroitin disaccharide hydrolase